MCVCVRVRVCVCGCAACTDEEEEEHLLTKHTKKHFLVTEVHMEMARRSAEEWLAKQAMDAKIAWIKKRIPDWSEAAKTSLDVEKDADYAIIQAMVRKIVDVSHQTTEDSSDGESTDEENKHTAVVEVSTEDLAAEREKQWDISVGESKRIVNVIHMAHTYFPRHTETARKHMESLFVAERTIMEQLRVSVGIMGDLSSLTSAAKFSQWVGKLLEVSVECECKAFYSRLLKLHQC